MTETGPMPPLLQGSMPAQAFLNQKSGEAAAASAFNLAFSAFRSLYANQAFLTRRWKWPLVITSILWNSS